MFDLRLRLKTIRNACKHLRKTFRNPITLVVVLLFFQQSTCRQALELMAMFEDIGPHYGPAVFLRIWLQVNEYEPEESQDNDETQRTIPVSGSDSGELYENFGTTIEHSCLMHHQLAVSWETKEFSYTYNGTCQWDDWRTHSSSTGSSQGLVMPNGWMYATLTIQYDYLCPGAPDEYRASCEEHRTWDEHVFGYVTDEIDRIMICRIPVEVGLPSDWENEQIAQPGFGLVNGSPQCPGGSKYWIDLK